MAIKKPGKKILKISGVFLGIIILFLIAFHFWFIHHAKGLLEDTVNKKSNGKLKLSIEKLSYNYFSHRMIINNAVFISTDTLTAPSAYRFSVKEIRLELKALLPLVLKKKLLIDSLHLQSPDIQVTTLRLSKDTAKKKTKDVSIPYEMGKVYHSIQDALKVLQVNSFKIEDGKFTLTNKAQTGQLPLSISNIHFTIDNLQVDTGRLTGSEKLLFSDNVTLLSNNQDILFPDGRHRLGFSRFRINLKKRLVEFDSCTIAATKTGNSLSSFNVFFDTLRLANIDFDTLYRAEVIKADSVYCLNPKFGLIAETGAGKPGKKSIPRLENIVQQLTGDLLLAYVGVKNADFNIQTIKNGIPTSFVFSNNNFEMQGLSVDQSAAKSIKVRSFSMAIRNYENFIKDSSYSIKFDSVRFRDNHLTLSSFLFNKLSKGKIINTISMPEFRLDGLSWDDLVFERKLKARSAAMLRPYISYMAIPRHQKQNLFQSLGVVNEYMDLDQLDITDGELDIKFEKNLQIQLQHADLSVKSQSLLSSTRLAGLKNSLNNLNFDNGKIITGPVSIGLKNVRYAGNNGRLTAGSVIINHTDKKIVAALQDVTVNKMAVDELTGNTTADGISWKKADINFTIEKASKKSNTSKAIIDLRKMMGSNTTLTASVKGKKISTYLNYISLGQFKKNQDGNIMLEKMTATGNHLNVSGAEMNVSASDYTITDKDFSSLRNLELKLNSRKINGSVFIPSLNIVTDIQQLISGNILADIADISHPVIRLRMLLEKNAKDAGIPDFPTVNINNLKLSAPDLNIITVSGVDSAWLHWQGNKNADNYLNVSGLQTGNSNASVKKIDFFISDFSFSNSKKKRFTTGDGNIAAMASNFSVEKDKTGNWYWQTALNKSVVKKLQFDSLGKKNGSLFLSAARLQQLQLNSSIVSSVKKLSAVNPDFIISDFTGHYINQASALYWYNASFNRNNTILSLDSFLFQPVLSRDSFLLTKKYQADYMQAGTGFLTIGPVNFEKLINDTILDIKRANIDKAFFSDYRDRSMPFNAGIIKPLPAAMIKKIPFSISVDSLQLTDANVNYTELNEKSRLPGIIPVTRMLVNIFKLKNYNLDVKDSLTIKATGYLMDTLWTKLIVRQSYTDSAGGFLLTMRLNPGDIKTLNSILIPLASVKLLSGRFDTISMRAVGREYLSMGEMKMFYENLKVKVIRNNQDTPQPLFTRLFSFFVNAFVLREKNKSKTGEVFFIRQRDRSAINYLIKIAVSGIVNSVGIKRNKKMLRKYRKEFEKIKLPPFDFE